jgi:hypothetical protein
MPDLLKQATDAQALMANPTPLIGAAIIYLAFWPLVGLPATSNSAANVNGRKKAERRSSDHSFPAPGPR